MKSVLPSRVGVSRQLGNSTCQFIAILLFVLLELVHCSDPSFHDEKSVFNKALDGVRYPAPRPQSVGGQLPSWRNQGAVAASKLHVSATRARDHTDASGTMDGQEKQVRENLSSKGAPDAEVKALVAFKAGLVRDPLDALRSWTVRSTTNDSDVCSTWAGVTCSPREPYHVIALSLPDLQLQGTLDSALLELAHLQFLQTLDLSMNGFTDFINGDSLSNFSRLSYFNISHNFAIGEVPFEIAKLTSVQELDFSFNNFTGMIPASLANCSFLRLLNLKSNILQGPIPPSFGSLSSLTYLILAENDLSGSIPRELGNCSLLSKINVANNIGIRDVLPVELAQLPLTTLNASECSLGGFVPIWIGNLTRLQVLLLNFNTFRGEIPETIGHLTSLRQLYIGRNKFDRNAFPLFVCNCTSLETLGLQNTDFTGPLPEQLGLLPNLSALFLYETTGLTGVIPSSLANCSALGILLIGSTFDSNYSMDRQPFPSWIGSLTYLLSLYLCGLNLEGEIPSQAVGNLSRSLTEIQLWGNYLNGTIPGSLASCVHLNQIVLDLNQLTGRIPSDFGLLRSLLLFSVANNNLRGPFPAFLVNWTQLAHFDVSTNNLSGKLDVDSKIGDLDQLQTFWAYGNGFEGPIPEALGNSSSITGLWLFGNRLSGDVPSSMGNMTSLQELRLQGNQLEGEIPVDLLPIGPQLGLLDLSLNQLAGSIPIQIGQLTGLLNLNLRYNNFNGTVPFSLQNCSNINQLDLSHNQFEGNIPGTAISAMSTSLVYLNLAHNLFWGSWSNEFSTLSRIKTINISANNLSGPIPLGLGNCLDLASLDISINRFSGEIPNDLGFLVKLEFFNASFNDFDGPIPQSGFFNSSSINYQDSFLGNPNLCGPPTIIGSNHEECAAAPRNVSRHESCKGFNCKNVYIPVSAAVASLVLLVLIFTGIILGWILCRGRRAVKSESPEILNFAAPMRFTESDVLRTINDPRGDNILGGGAKSIVYKGAQPGGVEFALKKLLPMTHPDCTDVGEGVSSDQMESELVKEAKILSKFRHRNVLKCLGFYSNLDLKALILEYMCEGSLHRHLHETETCKLPWQTRLKIAVGVGHGLVYLHHDFPEPLIHRDLKPSNILLDASLEPKVGDFGISKFVNPIRDGEATASTFCGTVGYIPPEYSSVSWVSTKGDVYSYGIILLELLTRRQPSSMGDLEGDGTDLRAWVLGAFNETPFNILDPSLITESSLDSHAMEQIMLLCRVGLFCTRAAPQSRPSMAHVVDMLKYIVDLGVEPVARRTIDELANDMDPAVWATEDPSIEGAEFGSSN